MALSRIRRGIKHPIPTELKKSCTVDAELEQNERYNRRWRYKPFLPSVIMGNANSLPNKCDELEALVRNQRLYKESSLICLSESWLNDNTPDSCVDIPGFTALRADHDRSTSGKLKGGGIIQFFNQRWVNPRNVTVKEGICCPDIELLSVGFHAFYAPREFPYTVVIVVYIPPRAAPTTACDVIHDAVARIQTQHPETFIAITGDFNHVSLSSCLTGFVQYVDCPTREEKTALC